MRKAITADVDKKTGITTVTVTLQDPMVTAAITDTVVVKLQEYITAYRVSKAQQDCAYLEQLYKERQQEYYSPAELCQLHGCQQGGCPSKCFDGERTVAE